MKIYKISKKLVESAKPAPYVINPERGRAMVQEMQGKNVDYKFKDRRDEFNHLNYVEEKKIEPINTTYVLESAEKPGAYLVPFTEKENLSTVKGLAKKLENEGRVVRILKKDMYFHNGEYKESVRPLN